MTAAFSRRGACPALSAPMRTGDGLLVRLNPVAGGFSPNTLTGLCEAALRHGNGVVEVTARGSFQIRGLTEISAKLLAGEVDALGIPVRTGVPVETGPLAGLDPAEAADPRPLAERIRWAIAAAGLEKRLGPKVSVVVDGGGHSGLEAVPADVRLTAERDGMQVAWRVAVAGDAARPLGSFAENAGHAAAIALLQAIAEVGCEARARDLTDEQICALKTLPAYRSTLPSSVLPDISSTRGEIGHSRRPQLSASKGEAIPRSRIVSAEGDASSPKLPISPLVEEMSGRTEGGAAGYRHLLGILALADARYAFGIGLPFGHTDAGRLVYLAAKAERLGASEIRLAPQRAILALCPSAASAHAVQKEAEGLDFVTSPSDPRRHIAACPGAPACASGHIPARDLAAAIAKKDGDFLDGSFALHVSGCAKGCAHPAQAALTLVGSENGAGIVLDGTARSAPLAYVPADGIAGSLDRTATLVGRERRAGETTAACLARLGSARIAATFSERKGAAGPAEG